MNYKCALKVKRIIPIIGKKLTTFSIKILILFFFNSATDPTQDTEISSSVLTSESENQPQTAETDEEEDYQFGFKIKYIYRSAKKLNRIQKSFKSRLRYRRLEEFREKIRFESELTIDDYDGEVFIPLIRFQFFIVVNNSNLSLFRFLISLISAIFPFKSDPTKRLVG